MAIKLNPYLTFAGNAREAMEFYKNVFGGELTLRSFKDSNMPTAPGHEDNIMHGELITTENLTIMGSDDPEGESNPTSIALSGEDNGTLHGYWEKLTEGATIIVPFSASPWGDMFGMLTDKFGMRWLVNAVAPKA